MDESISFLERVVSIPSPTGNTDEIASFLLNWCLDNSMNAEVKNNALMVNPEAERLLLVGHMDTVPGDLPVKIIDGQLWGRGSVDAKGPLCAALWAMKDCPSDIGLIGVPDEEGDSATAYGIREQLKQRPCIILEPSGWNGITIQYNGRMLVDLVVEKERSHSGSKLPFSAEAAYEIWNSIDRPRILSIRGDITKTEMRLDFRYSPGNKPHLPEGISILEDVPPYRSDKGSPLVRSLLRSIRSRGGTPVFKKKTGTSDMNILGEAWGSPIIAYGPGDGTLDHTDGEKILLDDYLNGIEVLRYAMRSL